MKRVHYGNLTIDVSDSVADAVLELAHAAASRPHMNFEEYGNPAFGVKQTQYAHGAAELAEFSGYINGRQQLSRVVLLLGAGFPIAVSTIDTSLDDPASSAKDESSLRLQVEEYGADTDGAN